MTARDREVKVKTRLSNSRLEQLFRQAQFSEALTYINNAAEEDLNDFQLSLKMDLYILNDDLPAADRLLASFGSLIPKHPHIYLALVRYHRTYQRPDGVCMVYGQFKESKWELEIAEHQYYNVQLSRFYVLALIDLGNYSLAQQVFEQLIEVEIVKNDPLLYNKVLATGINLYRNLHELFSYQDCTQKVIRVFKKLNMKRELVSPLLDQASIYTLMGRQENARLVLDEVKSILLEQPNDEMNPYVLETEAATYLYSGFPEKAFLLYQQAAQIANQQGAFGVYFLAPQNYTHFLQLRRNSPINAYDWFVQESRVDVPSTAVERALIYAYLAIAGAQTGQFNRDFFELGLATEDFALYIRVLAYISEDEHRQNIDADRPYFTKLSSLQGILLKDILQYDFDYIPNVASILNKRPLKIDSVDKIVIDCQVLDGLSIKIDDKKMNISSNLGGLIFAHLLISGYPCALSDIIVSLALKNDDKKSIRQAVKRQNERIKTSLGVSKDIIINENNHFLLNGLMLTNFDIDSGKTNIETIIKVEPENVLAGFYGQIFDEYREIVREKIVKRLIQQINLGKINDPQSIKTLTLRVMRSYQNEFELHEVLLPICKLWNLGEAEWLETQLNEVR
jgi:tetratricopeptide (TPR) repeat protein